MNRNSTFKDRLKVGNDKEELLVKILNSKGINSKLNNEENVKDIDIELTDDEMFVDSKYIETVFLWSKQFTGIEPENCLPINKNHVINYDQKEKDTNKRVWVAFLVDFKKFGIYEYRFFPNSLLFQKLKSLKAEDKKLNIDKNDGKTLDEFIDYLNKIRKIKQK